MTIIFSTLKRHNRLLVWVRAHILRTTPASHVAFGIDGAKVFHMSARGAVMTPRDVFIRKNVIIDEYEILADLSSELAAHLRLLGAPYDHASAVWHYVATMARPVKQLLMYLRIRNAFYCANFARQLDRNDRIAAWKTVDKYWASVEDLLNACQGSREFRSVTSLPRVGRRGSVG
ncbi:MAG TPA: hypothetical protein VMH39_03565 [Gemmatimonadaceae bacterium]|nr:hypothetical protein [Gemmatimonadaceae bacterium]